jgi:predicted phosphodiesterase
MKRIALFSDIHGNVPALEAVLADIAASAPDEVYCLGDLIGYGPDPIGVVERVRASGDATIQGNYDEGVAKRAGSCGCYYATDQARADGDSSYRFTDTMLDESSAQWLLERGYHIAIEEEDARVLLVHGSPRKINEYLLLDREEKQLRRLAAEAEADVVCHGHIHIPYHRSFAANEPDEGSPEPIAPPEQTPAVHYVSSGSVGKPKDGDPRAAWVELVLGTHDEVMQAAPADVSVAPIGTTDVWLGVVVHRLPYDIGSVADAMREKGLPETLIQALERA